MAETARIFFAALPARAIGDVRLTALHLKALAAIASHDRISGPRGKGQGCWAGNKRLAEMIGCNYSNLSTALSHLAEWGYIERRVNPMNRQRRIFFVIYSDRDAAFVGAKPGKDSLPTGKQSDNEPDNDSLPKGEDGAEIVCPDFQKSEEYQHDSRGEYIPLKRGINSTEVGEGNSDESASPNGGDLLRDEVTLPKGQRHIGRRLREIADLLKAVNGQPTQVQFDALVKAQHECWDIEEQNEGETIGYWAERLGDELCTVVEAAT